MAAKRTVVMTDMRTKDIPVRRLLLLLTISLGCTPELPLRSCYGDECAIIINTGPDQTIAELPDVALADMPLADMALPDMAAPDMDPADMGPPDTLRCRNEQLESDIIFTASRGARGQTFRATGTAIDRIGLGVRDEIGGGTLRLHVSLLLGEGFEGAVLAEQIIEPPRGTSALVEIDIEDVAVQPGAIYTLRIETVGDRGGFFLANRHDGEGDPYPDGHLYSYTEQLDTNFDLVFRVDYAACSAGIIIPEPDPCLLDQPNLNLLHDAPRLGQTFIATGDEIASFALGVFDDNSRAGPVRYTLSLHPGLGFDAPSIYTQTRELQTGVRGLAVFEPEVPIAVERGLVYTLQVERLDPRSDIFLYRHGGNDPYPDGHLLNGRGQLDVGADLQFRVGFTGCDE